MFKRGRSRASKQAHDAVPETASTEPAPPGPPPGAAPPPTATAAAAPSAAGSDKPTQWSIDQLFQQITGLNGPGGSTPPLSSTHTSAATVCGRTLSLLPPFPLLNIISFPPFPSALFQHLLSWIPGWRHYSTVDDLADRDVRGIEPDADGPGRPGAAHQPADAPDQEHLCGRHRRRQCAPGSRRP